MDQIYYPPTGFVCVCKSQSGFIYMARKRFYCQNCGNEYVKIGSECQIFLKVLGNTYYCDDDKCKGELKFEKGYFRCTKCRDKFEKNKVCITKEAPAEVKDGGIKKKKKEEKVIASGYNCHNCRSSVYEFASWQFPDPTKWHDGVSALRQDGFTHYCVTCEMWVQGDVVFSFHNTLALHCIHFSASFENAPDIIYTSADLLTKSNILGEITQKNCNHPENMNDEKQSQCMQSFCPILDLLLKTVCFKKDNT